MIRLEGITDSMDMSLSKLWETVKDREYCYSWGRKESDTTYQLNNNCSRMFTDICHQLSLENKAHYPQNSHPQTFFKSKRLMKFQRFRWESKPSHPDWGFPINDNQLVSPYSMSLLTDAGNKNIIFTTTKDYFKAKRKRIWPRFANLFIIK